MMSSKILPLKWECVACCARWGLVAQLYAHAQHFVPCATAYVLFKKNGYLLLRLLPLLWNLRLLLQHKRLSFLISTIELYFPVLPRTLYPVLLICCLGWTCWHAEAFLKKKWDSDAVKLERIWSTNSIYPMRRQQNKNNYSAKYLLILSEQLRISVTTNNII
jgi:hypothetical protein